jgi:predicted MFS family arabinose efflux permease
MADATPPSAPPPAEPPPASPLLARDASRPRLLLPLVLATIATQSSIVVLAPIVVEIGRDLDASVSAVGVARSVMAGVAVVVSLGIGALIDRTGVKPLLIAGASLALCGAGLTAAAPSLPAFYAAHVVTGGGIACLLSAGFAGVAAYFPDRDAAWAMGYVVGGQSIAWIVGNPLTGLLADSGSWRLAYLVPGVIAAVALVAAFTALGRGVGLRERPFLAAIGANSGRSAGTRAVARDRSARRWALAELVAYSAWTAELTYAGAFYIQSYGVEESAVGLLLAGGSIVFLIGSLSAARLARRFGRRRVVATSALLMGALLVPLLNLTPSVGFTFALFCVMALFASLRSTTSSDLGLLQLPRQPGSMMGARTASAQLGYTIGAALGGAVLALSGFGALGFVLFAGMALSALLIARVSEPVANVD